MDLHRFAPAKVNLFLHVIGRRADGYHEIESWITFLDVCDEVTVSSSEALSLVVDGPFARSLQASGRDEENLALQAARVLAQASGRPPHVAIRLTKNLPVASGLGGGSSDAAAVLALLDELWQIGIPKQQMDAMALTLGADVPVCLRTRAQWVEGIGELLTSAPFPRAAFVLMCPLVPLSTARVFGALHGKVSPRRDPPAEAGLHRVADWLRSCRNDLEEPARRLAPAVTEALEALSRQNDCLLVRMSGSGSTCFGLFADQDQAIRAAEKLGSAYPEWWIQVASSLSA